MGIFIEMPFFVLVGVLFGLGVVDLDSGKSVFGRRFRIFSWLFRHRGCLHSLFFGLIFSCLVGSFNLWLGFGVFVGFCSHLVMDAFTVR
ncbi:MAG: metal-dependent hydrolase, partial [Bacteroidales bacterium]|nr:metal-dependent hydrolase [Bacteroidales bacterium]